jgi:hypothetical protein
MSISPVTSLSPRTLAPAAIPAQCPVRITGAPAGPDCLGRAAVMSRSRFIAELTRQYTDLFANDARYAHIASKRSAAELAEDMTAGLIAGSADKEGDGIQRTCKALGIKPTWKAIVAFLVSPP